MTISVLRTADAWWVQTPTGAARIAHRRHHHRRAAGRPGGHRRGRGEHRHRAGGEPGAGLPGHGAVPRGGPDDQLRLARQGRRREPGHRPADLLPQGVRIDQRAVRRHRPARARAAAGLRGRDRPGHRPRDAGRHRRSPRTTWPTTSRAWWSPTTSPPATCSCPRPSSTSRSPTRPSPRSGPPWCCWTPTSSSGSASCGCGCRSTANSRQDMRRRDMIYPPVQALQALTRFQHLDPGDLLLTGTPVGTALSAPAKPVAVPRLAAAARAQVEDVLRRPAQQPALPAGRRRHRGRGRPPTTA